MGIVALSPQEVKSTAMPGFGEELCIGAVSVVSKSYRPYRSLQLDLEQHNGPFGRRRPSP